MPTSLSEALARLAEPGTSWDDFADVWHVRHRGALRHVCVAVGDGPWEVLHGTPTDDQLSNLERAFRTPPIDPEDEPLDRDGVSVFLRQIAPERWLFGLRLRGNRRCALVTAGYRPERPPTDAELTLGEAICEALAARQEHLRARDAAARRARALNARGVALFALEHDAATPRPLNERATRLAGRFPLRGDDGFGPWIGEALESAPNEGAVPAGSLRGAPWALQARRAPSGTWRLEISGGDERPLPSAALLREAFGLTDAELRVARALSGGGTAVETARQLGIRETTIRTHLRRLYAKTGTSGLGELVALLREPRWLDAPD